MLARLSLQDEILGEHGMQLVATPIRVGGGWERPFV